MNCILQLSISALIGLFLAVICLQIKPARAFAPASSVTKLRIALHAASSDDDDDTEHEDDVSGATSTNVLGTKMECCCANVGNTNIGTGFYRNGFCSTGAQDLGRHTVCVQVTDEFLSFSKSVGNDLSTPMPQYMFPGLKDGDIWCLCAQRWVQAYQMKPELAPKLFLRATHEKTLDYVPFDILQMYAVDREEAEAEKKSLDDQRAKLEKMISSDAKEFE
mmetsp:Transcript_32268/g.95050  ORF Transcript_32268/g.95050 Transcript_32268/m.95050 type:complete len:220 (+) Transcript_32268:309-968(+)